MLVPGKYGAELKPPLRGKRWPVVVTAFFKETVIGSKVEILPLKFKVLILVSLAITQKSVEFGLVLDKPRWFYHR